jgi:hypothetical protein
LTPNQALLFPGSYDEYVYHKAQMPVVGNQQAQQVSAVKKADIFAPLNKADSKSVATLEKKIAKTESEIKKIEQQFEQLVYATPEFVTAQAKLVQLQKELEDAMHAWEALI